VTGESFESRVINYARDREMLLVLDNLEHLLPVPFLTRLLTSCRQLTILATSREVLHLSGEFEYVVPPMDIPNLDAPEGPVPLESVESVALLVDRARQVRPRFTLTDENAADIAAICARLDGLPLAIELAAARLKIFSPAALLDRLSDRLSLLTGGPSDRPAHQRTIRDTIGWSHDLLSHQEQRVFRHLGVFMGSISAEAVIAVCMDHDDVPCSDLQALDELISLVDKSLVQRARQEGDGPRFYLLETIRHYALERLEAANELAPAKLRHAGYYLDVAEAALPLLIGPDQALWTARLEAEQVNMRSALTTLREANAVEDYTRLACALWKFWRLRGMLTEGQFWLDPTLEPSWQARLPPEMQAKSQFMSRWLALEQGDVEHAEHSGEGALAIARQHNDDSGMGFAYRLLSFVDSRLDRNPRAMERMEASLIHHRKVNDADSIAGALNNLAILALDAGEYDRVVSYCAESRDAFTALGNLHGASHSIDTMGVALYCLGRFEEAMRCSRESLAIDRQLADARGMAISLDHVGKCARALGDLQAAWEAHAESLQFRKDLGDPRGLLVWLEAVALWLAHAGCAEQAAMTLGVVQVTRTASTIPLQQHETGNHEETVLMSRQQLGVARFETLLARGRWISVEEMISQVQEVATARARELAGGERAPQDGLGKRFGLTPREHEVLLLIGRRFADKEIAEALSISPRTVARHVTGIFTKMNVHSRREAALLLEAHGEPQSS
jgi:predicted ATPase/DNA-binding CsgD family transcriptional regulator